MASVALNDLERALVKRVQSHIDIALGVAAIEGGRVMALDDLEKAELNRVRTHVDIALAGATEIAERLARAKAGNAVEQVERAIRELERAKLQMEGLAA